MNEYRIKKTVNGLGKETFYVQRRKLNSIFIRVVFFWRNKWITKSTERTIIMARTEINYRVLGERTEAIIKTEIVK